MQKVPPMRRRRRRRCVSRTWPSYQLSADWTLSRPMRLTFSDAFWLVIICTTLLSGRVQTQTNDPNGVHSTLAPTLPPVTCYFCVNVTSNDQCNRFAIDVPCPSGQTVCQNTHVMDHRGRTVSVDKKCSTDDACSSQVGCRQTGNQTICVGCCDVDYCNEETAHNESSAIFQRTRTAAFSAAGPAGRGSDAFHSIWILSSILLTLPLP